MNTEIAQRPEWEIDKRLKALIGEAVRVGAEAFVPLNATGESGPVVINSSELLLPDAAKPDAPVFFEGKLLSFARQVGVIYVQLEALPFRAQAANGRVLFRERPAVILHGPATVRLSYPFFLERIPADVSSYWQHLLEHDPQLSFSFVLPFERSTEQYSPSPYGDVPMVSATDSPTPDSRC